MPPPPQDDAKQSSSNNRRRNSDDHFVTRLLGEGEHADVIRVPDGGMVGLSNIGNTCFMNSGLQALLNCEPLVRAFVRRIPDVTENSIPGHYALLVQKYWSGSFAVLNPSDVLRDVWRINSHFQGFTQQDSQEFVRAYLDALHEETKRERRVEPIEKPSSPSPAATPKSPPSQTSAAAAGKPATSSSPLPPASSSNSTPPPPAMNGVSSLSSPHSASSNSSSSSPRPMSPHVNGESNSVQPPNTNSGEATSSSTRHSSKTLPLPAKRNSTDTRRSQSRDDSHAQTPHNGDVNSNSSSTSSAAPRPLRRRRPRAWGSTVLDLFGGQLRSEITCLECKSVSHSAQSFYDLSLEIPKDDRLKDLDSSKVPVTEQKRGFFLSLSDSMGFTAPTVSLSTCLHSFFTNENLESVDQYKCDTCKTKVDASKCFSLSRIPEVLVLHIKRFSHGYWSSKLSNHITFPPTLDMRPFVTESKLKEKCNAVTDYSLFAVVSHKGSLGSGHYVAYAKHPETGQWHEYDDRAVSKIAEEKVLSKQAYSIFYRRNQAGSQDPFVASAFKAEKLTPKTPKCLVATSWLQKVDTFSYPGPVDNSELCCKHGVPRQLEHQDRRELAVEIAKPGWDLLISKYGGGPCIDTTTPPPPCPECIEARLDRIRQHERQRILELDHSVDPENNDWFLMSEHWLMRWRSFIRRKTDMRPGPITNTDLLDAAGNPLPGLKPSYDYRGVSRGVWLELHKIYGGGPPIHRATIELYAPPLTITADDYAPTRLPRALQSTTASATADGNQGSSPRQHLSPEDNPGAAVAPRTRTTPSPKPAGRRSPRGAVRNSTRRGAGGHTSHSARPHMVVPHR